MQKSSLFLALWTWQMFYLQELRDTGKHICHPENLLLFPQLMHGHLFTIPCLYLYPRKTAWIRNSNQSAWNCLFPLGACSCSCRQGWGLCSWDCWLRLVGSGEAGAGPEEPKQLFPCPAAPNRLLRPRAWIKSLQPGQCVKELGIKLTLAEILCVNLGYCSGLEAGVGSGWVKEFKAWWS